ncbi:MAG TPA: hypothetical protein VK932_24880 [Kofleriaceae bacterium]|nr:hypothetical protein [Kofleriaceae bacterium]
MIFDQPPAELPVATVRSRDPGSRLLLDVRRWILARWRWLRPRAIPVTAAFAGMLGVLAWASYLRELAHQAPERLPAAVRTTPTAHTGDAMEHICVVAVPSGGMAVARPITAATVTSAGGESVYRVQLEHSAPAPASR